MILYKKDKKNTSKTIFIGGFIFKEYEDNRRDQMHWMRSYEAGLLVISNYTHHLHETIIMHHPIYIFFYKKNPINFKVHFRMWTVMVLQQATLIQRWVGITFHAWFMKRMSNHN